MEQPLRQRLGGMSRVALLVCAWWFAALAASAVDVTFSVGASGNADTDGLPSIFTAILTNISITKTVQVSCVYGDGSAGPTNLSLDADASYTGTVRLDRGMGFCGGTSAHIHSLPSCFDPYFNGENRRGQYPQWRSGQLYASYDKLYTFDVQIRHNVDSIVISEWQLKDESGYGKGVVQKERYYSISADGMSQAIATVMNTTNTVTFSLVSGPSDCTLSNRPYGAVLTAGTNQGTAHVQAQSDDTDECLVKDFYFDLVTCDGGCGSGDCDDQFQNNSVDVRLSLGPSMVGSARPFLQIKASAPATNLGSPETLRYNFIRPDFEVIRDGVGWLRQLRAVDRIVDVTTNSAASYSIRFYNRSATNVFIKTNGLYILTNSPFKTVTVSLVGGDTNHFQASSSLEAGPADYYWETNGWALVTGNGLRRETKSTSTNGTVRVETRTVKDAQGNVVYRSAETWQSFSYGDRLLTNVVGSGVSARTESRIYDSAGRLQQANHADGSWEIFAYDSMDRQTGRYSVFLNSAPTTNLSQCRFMALTYDNGVVSGSGDDATLEPYTPRRVVEYVQGHEVGRRYMVVQPGERWDIQCVTPGAAWNAADNLATTNNYRMDAVFLGKPNWVARPGGVSQSYSYTWEWPPGDTSVVAERVTVSSSPDGTKEETWTDSTQRLRARRVTDNNSEIVLNLEQYSYDERGRLTNTLFYDGTTAKQAYDCCKLVSQTSRDGAITTYGYDDLKRLVTTTLNGVTVSNFYNANDAVIGTVRYGTDGSRITNALSTFDDGGQLATTTVMLDGVTNVTTYTNYFDGSGQWVHVTVHADTGTEVETRFRDGSVQSRTGTAVFPSRYEYGVEQDGGVYRLYTKEIKLDSGGSDSGEWTKTYKDMAGREYKTVYSSADGTPVSLSYYNLAGQLTNQIDPDGVSRLYKYRANGEREYEVTDLHGDRQLHLAGSNRVTRVFSDVIYNSTLGEGVRRTRTYVWPTVGVDASNLVATVERGANGLRTLNTVWNNGVGITSRVETLYVPASGYKIETNSAADGSYTVTTNQNGRRISITRRDSAGTQIGRTTYGYDAYGRQNTITDARTGTTTNFWNNLDQISGTVTPKPDSSQSAQVTTNYVDSMGRIWKTTLPDGTSVTNEYFLTGLPKRIYGSRQYPVAYTYDAQGRVKTMTTYQDFTGSNGVAVTTWNYDAYGGFLTSKLDASSQGESYTRTPTGKLLTRTLARNIARTNNYNAAGDLRSVTYSDSATPNLVHNYDRQGRLTGVTQSLSGQFTNSVTLAYNDAGESLSETNTGGILAGLSVTNAYDTRLRRAAVGLSTQPSTVNQFGYDNASRLATVTNGLVSASYSYLTNSPLWGTLTFKQNGTNRMTTTRQFDNLNRLTNISSASFSFTSSFAYQHNNANQRTRATLADGSYWVYVYDSLGQVTSGKRYWSDGTPVAGQQFEYAFDDIGNRKTAKMGGNQTGGNLRQATYGANLLNQYTNRTVPSAVDIISEASSNAIVTVNFERAVRQGGYFWKETAVSNASAPAYQTVLSIAVLNNGTNADTVVTNTGNVLVPKVLEAFFYDADGNLLSDGLWTNTWNAENQLIQAQSVSAVPDAAKLRLAFVYDYQGRRVQKVVSAWNGSNYVAQATNRFIYDGWNLLAELNRTNGLIRSYVWGLDLSGTPQGAGGVGGLLAVNTANNGTHLACFDGNGNVTATTDASNGVVSAQFEYGPFGESIGAFGSVGNMIPIRFSTKYVDGESGWNYYGYRYYNPSGGRWLSSDPLKESGGLNLYSFAGCDAISHYDVLGRNLGFDEALNALVLAVDLATGAGYATIALDIAVLAIPFVPTNPRAGLLIVERLGKEFQVVRQAELRQVEFITKVGEGGEWTDLASRPQRASVTMEYRGRLPNGTANAPYDRHFQFFARSPEAAKSFTAGKNKPSQFMPGIGDEQVRKYIDEAFQKFKRDFKSTSFSQLDGYVYNTTLQFGTGRVRTGDIGYSKGECVSKIKLHVSKDGSVHAFPTVEAETPAGQAPRSFSLDED